MKFRRRSTTVPNLAINFSEVKVKVQGQKCRTDNGSAVVLRYLHQIWQSNRHNFSIKYDLQQHSRWQHGGGRNSCECFRSVNSILSSLVRQKITRIFNNNNANALFNLLIVPKLIIVAAEVS